MLVACVGGGSNAMGLFAPFLKDTGVACIGVEAGGRSSAAGEDMPSDSERTEKQASFRGTNPYSSRMGTAKSFPRIP